MFFISIMLDETPDVSCFSQFSVVFRYVNADGIICERFIEFTNVSKDRIL